MADLEVDYKFRMELTPQEFVLVCKALRRKLSGVDNKPAEELAGKLAEQKVSRVKHMLGEIEKLDRSIK